jgi:hypothetical protein
MRFGRLQKHLTEIRNDRLLRSLEQMVDRKSPASDMDFLAGGYDERDLGACAAEGIYCESGRNRSIFPRFFVK